MARTALTQADWQRFGRASMRWADDAEGDRFREEVEAIVRHRMALAWKQGFKRGWHEGVKDAMEDDGGDNNYPNPYE